MSHLLYALTRIRWMNRHKDPQLICTNDHHKAIEHRISLSMHVAPAIWFEMRKMSSSGKIDDVACSHVIVTSCGRSIWFGTFTWANRQPSNNNKKQGNQRHFAMWKLRDSVIDSNCPQMPKKCICITIITRENERSKCNIIYRNNQRI